MLYFLTGDIQVGKTRWLESAIADLARAGVSSHGVIAPGRWLERPGGAGFEKAGIDNVLLPQGDRIAFAEPGGKGWVFDQAAIDRVNGHLRSVREPRGADGSNACPGFLVIDELGWMELLRGRGLTAALDLLDAGADDAFPHALAVVRESLLPQARARLGHANWGGVRLLRPDDTSRAELLAAWR